MTVVKITTSKTDFGVKEHWTAVSIKLLEEELAKEISDGTELGYITSIHNVRQDPTGMLYHAEVHRQLRGD